MTGQTEQQGVEVGILTGDEKADINMRLDKIAARMDSETDIATALGAIVEEFGRPRGLTVSVLQKDLNRRRKAQAMLGEEREAELVRIASLPEDQQIDEIAAIQPRMGKGWTQAKITKEVEKRIPVMTMDEVDHECFKIAQMDPAVRGGAVDILTRSARKRHLPLDRKEIRGKIERAVANLANGNADADTLIVADDHDANAKLLLNEVFQHEEGPTIRYAQKLWYVWSGSRWEEIDAEKTRFFIRRWATGKHTLDDNQVPQKFKPTIRFVDETMEALKVLAEWDTEHMSGSLWFGPPLFDGPMLSVHNGILNVMTGKLYNHTPRLFNLTSVNASWHGIRKIDKSDWGRFIASITPEKDEDQTKLLQEFFGYSLTDLTHMQKGLMLIGPKRSGKGTILRTIEDLLGMGSVHAIQMEKFGKDFPLMGAEKAAIISMPDIRTDKETRFGPIAETMLTAIGEDTVSIDRKYIGPWQGRLTAKWWGLSNSMPRFRDQDGVLASRYVYCQLSQSFFGHEDTGLQGKISSDRDSVLIWAVQGLRRMIRNGMFTKTQRGEKLAAQAGIRQDPIGAFIAEYLDLDTKHAEKKDALFAAFHMFAERHNVTGFTSSTPLAI